MKKKLNKNKFSTCLKIDTYFTASCINLERCEQNLILDIAVANGPAHIYTDCLFQTAFVCPSKPLEIADLESQCLAEYKAMKKAKCNTTGKYESK